MLSWLKSFIWKPKEEEKVEKKKIVLMPKTHYMMTPLRILEWWNQEPKLDPLPKYPPSPKNTKETAQ